VTLNRFTNVAVHEDEYKVCCGAVGKCAKDCTKHVRRPKKTGLRAPQHLPPAVQEAKKNYARAVMAACAPHIVQGKIGGLACRRTLCQEFNDNKRGKGERRGHSKLMLPGMACGTRCNAYPCVVKLARAEFPACQAALGEFNGLAAVQAWRSQPAPPGAAGASGDYAGAAGAAGADGEAAAAAAGGAMQTE
jgi:hypothetical protein